MQDPRQLIERTQLNARRKDLDHSAACALVRRNLLDLWGPDEEHAKRKLLLGLGYRFDRRHNRWHRGQDDVIHPDHPFGAVVSILVDREEVTT